MKLKVDAEIQLKDLLTITTYENCLWITHNGKIIYKELIGKKMLEILSEYILIDNQNKITDYSSNSGSKKSCDFIKILQGTQIEKNIEETSFFVKKSFVSSAIQFYVNLINKLCESSNYNELLFESSFSNYLFVPRKKIRIAAEEEPAPIGKCVSEYEFSDLEDYFNICFNYFYEHEIKINKCKNCSKFFIPRYKKNEKYCDNIFENNKTCKELAIKINQNKDEITKMYNSYYKMGNNSKNSIVRTGNIERTKVEEKWEEWKTKMKEKELQIIYESKTSKNLENLLEEYKKWLDNNRFLKEGKS